MNKRIDGAGERNRDDDSMSTGLPVDFQARIDALDRKKSICVTAPAGSGKTELLTQRVLTLLASANQPEEILAITFTRKAAAEMHYRIIDALRTARDNPQPLSPHKQLSWNLARAALEQDKQRDWNILANPKRLKIQTIDSLCSFLTRHMPILSNFGAQPLVTEQAVPLYTMAVRNLLEQIDRESFYNADLLTLLRHLDNDMQKAERLLVALLSRRDQWLVHVGIGLGSESAQQILEDTLSQIIDDTLRQIHAEISPAAAELLPLFDYAGCNMQWAKKEADICSLAGIVDLPDIKVRGKLDSKGAAKQIEQWLGIADLLLTKTHSWRKSVTKTIGFPTETQDGDKALAKKLKSDFLQQLGLLSENESLLQLLIDLRHLPSGTYSSTQWLLLESLTRLLPVLVAQLRLVFQRESAVDFSEVSIAAATALGDSLNPTELALKLDSQLRHILIDEFQDTSSTQYRLLHRLLEGWQEHNIANSQDPNTLFIVGDGMQSIYGFREANVGLFLDAKKAGVNSVGLQDLKLSVNFRSDPAVVSWINNTFKNAFPATENISHGAVPYEYSHAFSDKDIHSKVEVFGFTGEDSRRSEAEKVVELVLVAQEQNPLATIAVLVRSRSSLLDIIPALTRSGLRWSASDINPLKNYSVVADLLSLTKAMLNSADKVSWSALLRTPWIGLSNTDIHTLLGADRQNFTVLTSLCNDSLVSRLSLHGRQRVSSVAPILKSAINDRQRLDIRSWLEGLWISLGGASSLSGADELVFVDDYFDLLEKYSLGNSQVSMIDFEQAMSSLYAKSRDDDATLKIMTIHKSKGLEFDVVILPGLSRVARSDDRSLLMWGEYIAASPLGHKGSRSEVAANSGLVISPLAQSGEKNDAIYEYLRFEQSRSAVLESTRLLYVAATRTIGQLYLLFTGDLDAKSSEPKSPPKNSLLSSIWDSVASTVNWQHQQVAENQQFGWDFSDEQLEDDTLQRIRGNWREPRMNVSNPLAEFYLDGFNEEENIPDDFIDPVPVCVGIVCHWILEHFSNSTAAERRWKEMQDGDRILWINALLQYERLDKLHWAETGLQVLENIRKVLADDKGRWILFGDHKKSSSELELLLSTSTSLRKRIIDRCFISSDNECWIVDYKTSRPAAGELRDDFIARESTQYLAQMRGYEEAIANHPDYAEVSSIRLALYFTFYPQWVELAGNDIVS